MEITDNLRNYGKFMNLVGEAITRLDLIYNGTKYDNDITPVLRTLFNANRVKSTASDFSASDLPAHYKPLLEILDESLVVLDSKLLRIERRRAIGRSLVYNG